MDVVCERCKAEYEFDDALVSERGTTVKCTNCSHQFKIFRPTSESDAAKVWNLRRPDGTVIPFDSLAVLQKWILEGKVSKMDEISRAGEGWKSLGAIAELESFFATAELRASQNAPGRAGQRFPSMNGVRSPTPAPTTSGSVSRSNPAGSSKPGAPMSSPTIRPGGAAPPPPPPVALRAPSQGGSGSSGLRAPSQSGAAPSNLRAPSQGGTPPPVPTHLRGPSGVKPAVSTMVQIPPPPKMPTEMGPPSSPLPVADRHEPLVDEVERARPRSVPPKVALPPLPTLTTPPRDLVDDQAPTRSMNSDVMKVSRSAPPPPEKRSGLGVGLVIGAVIAVIAVGVSWRMSAPNPATPGNTTTPAVDNAHRDAVIGRATEKTRRYSAAAFDEAREELNTAITLNPADAVLTATRAEVFAAWSEMLSQQADDLDAQAAAPGADVARLQAEAQLLRREAGNRKDRARSDLRTAEGALGTVPAAERPVVEARLADAARVVRENSVTGHLEAARRATPTAETSLYLALASISDDAASATAGLRAALSSEPQNHRARVALARLLKQQGDARGAHEVLDEGLRADASHEALLGLSRSLGPGVAANADAGAVAAAVDAGSPQVAAVTPPVAVPANPAPTNPAPTNPAPPIVIPPETAGHHTSATAEPGGPMPQGYDRLVQSGDQLQHAGRSALARERYQAALAARPNGSEALVGLGYVELDGNNVSAAVSRFRQALSSNPRYSEAYIGLGEAYSHQRSYTQAVQAYRQYLEINPGGSRAEMARRQIESLQERINAAQAPAPESATADAATSP